MKTLLLDADGVVIKRHRYFSERLAEEQGVPVEVVTKFFKNEFPLCQVGKADLKETLAPYLSEWKWEQGVDALVDYWFTVDTVPDEAVLEKVAALRARGVKVYLASGQEQYRAEYIERLLRDKLDGFFFTYTVGCLKSDVRFFKTVLAELGVPGADVRYVDDTPRYLDAANTLGIETRFYTGGDALL